MLRGGLFRDSFSKKKIILFFLIGIVIVSVILILILMNNYEKCNSWDCFNYNLENCKKTKFAGGREMIFGYTINGKNKEFCEVEVVLLQGKLTNQETLKLKDYSMVCNIPLGSVILPESDLTNCHGILKENLQEQTIIKLHNYISQNLGQINAEMFSPLNNTN
ncbi:MAG: hypothetical protein WC260_02035 [Candidatus Pacearchaeota archaeon]